MATHDLAHEAITAAILGAFYEVFNGLGFGYYEATYMAALEHELRLRGRRVAREVVFDVVYKGYVIGRHRLDMLVEGCVVVEAKATVQLPPTAKSQLHTYLHGAHHTVGLVLHFGPEPKAHRVYCSDFGR
jgi:GxxExxY protein